MNKKTLIILGILFIILAGLVLAYFFIFKKTSPEQNAQTEINKDGFVIQLPGGWVEVEAVMGSFATAMNNKEQINNADAAKIGFRSYYSVVYDTFNEKTDNDYLEKIETSLKGNFPEVKISKEEDKNMDGEPIYFMEADIIQQDIDFKVLLAVNIKDKDVWIISFNTLKESWDEYKNLFHQIAGNFQIK
ncbi:MAG TPA: hypothetical protein VMW82_02755 [Candidatus Paceibacterota bacterium]|nr:hypothetical protein [Candidatus Paceibacterota bacterium]